MSDELRCKGATRRGARCRNPSRSGSDFCHLHQESTPFDKVTPRLKSPPAKQSANEGHSTNKYGRYGYLGYLGLAVAVFLIRGALAPSPFEAGKSAYERGDFDKAVERLSRVEPGDDGYSGEARNLLLQATHARDSTLIVRAEAYALNWEWEKVRSLLIPVLENPAQAGPAQELLDRADAASDYEDLWYATGRVNVRDEPSERGSVTFPLEQHDAVRLSPPDSNGWAPVHNHYPSREGYYNTLRDGGANAISTADTLGFVYSDALSSEQPQFGAIRDAAYVAELQRVHGATFRRLVRKCRQEPHEIGGLVDRALDVLERERGFRLSQGRFMALLDEAIPASAGRMNCAEVAAMVIMLTTRP